jgi:hypothetical protein
MNLMLLLHQNYRHRHYIHHHFLHQNHRHLAPLQIEKLEK